MTTYTYKITASYTHNGRIVDCTTPEVLGELYGASFVSRKKAEEAAQELRDTVADFEGLDESTIYEVEEVESFSRDAITWECHAGSDEPICDLDPQDGDMVADYALDCDSLRWDALVDRCRSAGLVLVFDSYDPDAAGNAWSIRDARVGEVPGSCIGI